MATAPQPKPATLSTCPRTEPAPSVSSEFRILSHESQSEFDTLTLRLYEEFEPQGEHETFLVDLMAQARWQIARAHRLENAAFEFLIGESLATPDARIVAALSQNGRDPLTALQRYAASAERSYARAHREFLQSRRSNIKLEIDRANAFVTGILTAPRPSVRRPPTKNGFASQNEPLAAPAALVQTATPGGQSTLAR